MHNVVFMGTPDFAIPVLQTLLATQRVVGVVTQPDRPAGRGQQLRPSPVKVVAEAAGVPVYQPASLRKAERAAPIAAWQPDAVVVAAYGQILRPHVLDLPPLGCINVHASLLPRWRGAAPIQHALLAGDSETGVCLMRMDVGLDTGPVYVGERLAIAPDETAQTLHDRLAALGADMIGRYLDRILDGHLYPLPQNDALMTYAPMIGKDDGALRWEDSAESLARRIRAMTPWPGAFTTWDDDTLKILAARPVADGLPPGAPGDVVRVGDDIVVLTGHDGLALEQVQPAGKRAVDARAFVNGRPHFIGSRLRGPESAEPAPPAAP